MLRSQTEWMLRGRIIAVAENTAAEATYEVICNDSWQTKSANIFLRDGRSEQTLQVIVENGEWYCNGHQSEAVRGCVDIDLEWSPSTNTLPIRRCRLAVGEKSGVLNAAWVRFPSLRLELLSQEYERISEGRYRYSARSNTFIAEIAVDDEGLALEYQGLWRRIA